MKFLRGKENQIINLEFVEIIDIVEVGGKLEVQAKLADFSVELAEFEHMDHAKAFLDDLWSNTICAKPERDLRSEASRSA